MIRTLDPAPLIELASHPLVRPFLGGTDDIAPVLTQAVANVANYAFLAEHGAGAYLYVWKAQGIYEVHTLGQGEGKDRQMVREMAKARSESLRFMFMETDATEVVTIVPKPNTAAFNWATHAGFKTDFTRANSFDLMGEKVDAFYMSLPYGAWVLSDPANRREGETFHAFIHQHTADDHGEDEIHDAWVGATLDGATRGNGAKCIAFYNRFAIRSGYEPLRVLTLNPLVFDMRSAIVMLSAEGLECLHVREPREAPLPDPNASGESSCPLQPSPLAQA